MQKAQAKCPVKRLWISSMTDEADTRRIPSTQGTGGLPAPPTLAGLSRAIGDWLLGMNATRLYTLKYGQNKQVLSIGRVQTPTLASDRKPTEGDRTLRARALLGAVNHLSRHHLHGHKRGKYTTKEEGEKAFETIADKPFTVTSVQKKNGTEAPPHLYDLTSLQVDCNRKFSMSAEQTLNIIQSLYERKLTTYPRVDTQYLSDDIYPKCPQIMNGLFQVQA